MYDVGLTPCRRLGKISLTDTGIFRREMQVLSTCVAGGYPVALSLGWLRLKPLVYRHSLIHRAASEVYRHYRL